MTTDTHIIKYDNGGSGLISILMAVSVIHVQTNDHCSNRFSLEIVLVVKQDQFMEMDISTIAQQ